MSPCVLTHAQSEFRAKVFGSGAETVFFMSVIFMWVIVQCVPHPLNDKQLSIIQGPFILYTDIYLYRRLGDQPKTTNPILAFFNLFLAEYDK